MGKGINYYLALIVTQAAFALQVGFPQDLFSSFFGSPQIGHTDFVFEVLIVIQATFALQVGLPQVLFSSFFGLLQTGHMDSVFGILITSF